MKGMLIKLLAVIWSSVSMYLNVHAANDIALDTAISHVRFSNDYIGFYLDNAENGATSGETFVPKQTTSNALGHDSKADVSMEIKALFSCCFEDIFVPNGNGSYSIGDINTVQNVVSYMAENITDFDETTKTIYDKAKSYNGADIPDSGYKKTLENGDVITFHFRVMTPNDAKTKTYFAYKIDVSNQSLHKHEFTELKYNSESHWYECQCGSDQKGGLEAHTGGNANCITLARCDLCKQSYGSFNYKNHSGYTEVRGKLQSTTDKPGYTGDTYCLECETVVEYGKEIPKLNVHDGSWQDDAVKHWEEVDDNQNHSKTPSYLIKQATSTKDGLMKISCDCGYSKQTTIGAVNTVQLSKEKFAYDGKVKKPTLKLVDKQGYTLKEGLDYSLSYASGRKNIGKYSIKITLQGLYSGTKTVSFSVLPEISVNVSAELYGYDDAKISWNEASGITGYNVYYKKSSSNKYTLLTNTKSTYVYKENLSDGVEYTFKVVPYKTINNVNYESYSSKTASVITLNKLDTPKLTQNSETSVTVKWNNIKGETGYEISRSTGENETNIVSTYKTTSGTSKKLDVKLGEGNYYKVRAYKTVGDKTIYGPWSNVKYYKTEKKTQTNNTTTSSTSSSKNVIGTYKDSTSKITVYKEWYQNAYCYIAHIEFTDYSRFKTACANGKYNNGKETIKHAYNRLNNPVLIINGCYSSANLNYPVVRNGKVWNNKNCILPAVYSQKSGLLMSAWEGSGDPRVYGKKLSVLAKDKTVTDTFSFGPPILQGGKITVGSDKSRAQRTFIGTNGKAGDIWVVVSEGRKKDGKSSGLTYRQCAQLLKNKGCKFGVPLDGGGSSTMIFKGKTLNQTSGRKIVDFVYFK